MRGLYIILPLLILSASARAEDSIICPSGAAQNPGDAPKIVVKGDKNTRLIVCGSESVQLKEGTKKQMTDFSIFMLNAKGDASPSLKEVTTPEQYWIQPAPRGLSLQHLIWDGYAWSPTFETDLICVDESCAFSKPKCIFEKGKVDSLKDLEDFKSYFTGKGAGKKSPDEALISGVARIALSGNSEALKIFLRRPEKLKLDGLASDMFFKYSKSIHALKEAGCL